MITYHVIDTTRLSAHVIRNHLFNVDGTTVDFVVDTAKSGGSSTSKYITKPILLENVQQFRCSYICLHTLNCC